MSTDARRDSDQRKDLHDPSGRRREIDARTRGQAEKISADESAPRDVQKARGTPDSLPRLTAREQQQRLDRISERSSMRHLPDFDAAREQRQEDIEIRNSPVAYLRRQEHAGLDSGTVKLVRHSLESHGVDGPEAMRAQRVEDTWGIWEGKAD